MKKRCCKLCNKSLTVCSCRPMGKKKKRRIKIENKGTQHQLGLVSSGRWCRRGCCDLDKPQQGDCHR